MASQAPIVYLGATAMLTALGRGTAANFEAVASGASGLVTLTDTALSGSPLMASRVDDALLIDAPQLTRFERLAATVVIDVLRRSGVGRSRVGLIVSTTKGNIASLGGSGMPEAGSPVFIAETAQRVADFCGIETKPISLSNACISGVSAVIIASRLIRAGIFESMIVVGADELTRFVVTGFDGFKSLSHSRCRPYDAARDGLNLGEGSAALLLTSDAALGEGIVVEGGAITDDANHISGPSRTGQPLADAIGLAMSQSGLRPADVSFVNAHGTATAYNDEMESKAIALAGLAGVPVNSLKPYFGHTLGASGAIEIALCAEQLRHGLLLGTPGYEVCGVPEPLMVSAAGRRAALSRCVKTASGFGGCNAAVVLAAESVARPVSLPPSRPLHTARTVEIAHGEVLVDGSRVFGADGCFADFIRAAFRHLDRPNMKFFKMDNLCKLGYVGAEFLLDGVGLRPGRTAIVLANRSASLDSDCRHRDVIAQSDSASPAVFVYTLPNVVMGEICIRHKITGENSFFIVHEYDENRILQYARTMFAQGFHDKAIVGFCELLGEDYRLRISLLETK